MGSLESEIERVFDRAVYPLLRAIGEYEPKAHKLELELLRATDLREVDRIERELIDIHALKDGVQRPDAEIERGLKSILYRHRISDHEVASRLENSDIGKKIKRLLVKFSIQFFSKHKI